MRDELAQRYGAALVARMEAGNLTEGKELTQLLLGEITRLRALVKDMERGSPYIEGLCLFCAADLRVELHGSRIGAPSPCPAFTPDGQVR